MVQSVLCPRCGGTAAHDPQLGAYICIKCKINLRGPTTEEAQTKEPFTGYQHPSP